MSKLGIALQALALSSMTGGYVPPSYYRRQGTYQRNPYEGKPKQRSDSPINTAALPATHAGVGAPGGGGSCSVNQTITSTTTFTVPTGCTSLIFDVWGRGGNGQASSSLSFMIGGGGGGFSRGTLGVSAGEHITAKINPTMLGGYHHNYVNYVCPTASAGCGQYPGSTSSVYNAGVGGCRTSVWTTATSVCALNSGIYGGAGTATAIGNLKFAGANYTRGSGNYGGAGGGAAGPDGNGVNGTPSTGIGGAGDAGSGGAGGAHGVSGTSNTTKGGGGGGSGPSSGTAFGPGNGGAPGGGGGGSRNAGYGSGAGGQIIIHSSSLEEDKINNAGGGYGGGMISAV